MAASWLTVLLVLVALVLGLVGNRWWARRSDVADDDGFDITDLVGPVTTLATILLAFTLVQSLSSYDRARENIGTEARLVDAMAESAGRLDDQAVGSRIRHELVCYGEAVTHQEWGTDGERSPHVSLWTGRIEDELANLKRSQGGDGELDRLISLDIDRGGIRLARITESMPSIPTAFSWLMLIAVLISVIGLGLFVRVKGRRTVYIGVLAVFTLLLASTLFTINDLDQPFVGFNRLDPTEMERVVEGLETDLRQDAPQLNGPCNDKGVARAPLPALMAS